MEPGSKFTFSEWSGLKGVLLDVNVGTANVYWYSVPKKWLKKYYDNETLLDKHGRYYEGLDVYYLRKKTIISPDTEVLKINAKQEGKGQKKE